MNEEDFLKALIEETELVFPRVYASGTDINVAMRATVRKIGERAVKRMKEANKKKIMVLFSGGLDSSTALALAVKEAGAENVLALSVRYGQKHAKEVQAAERVAAYYGVELLHIDLTNVFIGSDCSLIEGAESEVPKTSYAEQLESTNGSPVSTYVPFRNGLFLSAAASMAIERGCSEIIYGAHRDDAAGNAYPDCSAEFTSAIGQAIYLGSGEAVRVRGPFVNMNKAEIVKLGTKLGVPYELTWSCYEGGEKPCGKCGTCRDRAKAFRANGLVDPLD